MIIYIHNSIKIQHYFFPRENQSEFTPRDGQCNITRSWHHGYTGAALEKILSSLIYIDICFKMPYGQIYVTVIYTPYDCTTSSS